MSKPHPILITFGGSNDSILSEMTPFLCFTGCAEALAMRGGKVNKLFNT